MAGALGTYSLQPGFRPSSIAQSVHPGSYFSSNNTLSLSSYFAGRRTPQDVSSATPCYPGRKTTPISIGAIARPIPKSREDLLNDIFQRAKREGRLEQFLKRFPLGALVHEHLGPHPNTQIKWASDKDLYLDLSHHTWTIEGGEGCISAKSLQLQIPEVSSSRIEFYKKVTLVKECNTLVATEHFFQTFLLTGSANVPFHRLFVDEYSNAVIEKLQSIMLMVDLPDQTEPGTQTLPDNPEDLTDEVLDSYYKSINEWLISEVEYWEEHLLREGMQAKERLGLSHDFFSLKNDVHVCLQVEVGKCYAHSCRQPDVGGNLARYAKEVAKGLLLVKRGTIFKSINCVGPEHFAKGFEPMQAKILDYFYRKIGGRISYHSGELNLGLTPGHGMYDIILRVISACHPVRIGHGTCYVYDQNLHLLKERDIPIEVCPTACVRLQGCQHPFVELVKAGIPIIVSTDNRNVFLTTLEKEYISVIEHWDGMTYGDLVTLVRNSLHYSDLNGESIYSRADGRYQLGSEFKKYIKHRQLAFPDTFSEKQVVQIKQERELLKFESDILAADVGSTTSTISASPPKADPFAQVLLALQSMKSKDG